MKKYFSYLLVLVLILGLVVGCGGQKAPEPAKEDNKAAEQTNEPAKKEYKWRLAQSKASQHPVSQGYNKFAEIVAEKSGGRITIDVFNDALLGNDREVIEGAQSGTLEFAGSSTPNMASFTNIFTAWDLPYIFESKDEVYKAIDGEPGILAAKEMEKSGFKVIFFPDYGFRQVVNNQKEIKLPADLKGMKVRTTNSPVEIADYKAFGANPTPVAWGEVYTALQQGTVQGGYPWVNEMIIVAQRNANVYLELSEYEFFPQSEAYMHAVNTIISDKVIYASAHPFVDFRDALENYNKLPLKDDVREKVMFNNAAKILGIDIKPEVKSNTQDVEKLIIETVIRELAKKGMIAG